MSTRTEKPTQAHLKRLRQQGLVVRSRLLPSAVACLIAITLAPTLIGSLLQTAKQQLLSTLHAGTSPSLDQLAALAVTNFHGAWLLLTIGLSVVTTILLFVGITQTGGLVLSAPMGSSQNRTRPWFGLSGAPFLVWLSHLAQVLLPIVLVWLFAGWLIVHHATSSVSALGNVEGFSALLATQGRQLLLGTAGLLTALGLLDWVVQWHAVSQQSLQTPEARKREEREQNGAPETLLLRRRRREELAQLPPLKLLPYCQLILDDQDDTALLVAYRLDIDSSPQVIGVVRGSERRAVVEAAITAQLAVVGHPWLIERLLHLPLEPTAPLEVQQVLAEVLAERLHT